MASSREYLDFILEQLSGVNGITSKQMMGNTSCTSTAGSSAAFMMTGSWSNRQNQQKP